MNDQPTIEIGPNDPLPEGATVEVSLPESTMFNFGTSASAGPIDNIIKQIKDIHIENGWTPA